MLIYELLKKMEKEYDIRTQPPYPGQDPTVGEVVQIMHRQGKRVMLFLNMLGRLHVQFPIASFPVNSEINIDALADKFEELVRGIPSQAAIMSRMQAITGSTIDKDLILIDVDVSSYINLSRGLRECEGPLIYVMSALDSLLQHLDNVWRVCYDVEACTLSNNLLDTCVFTDTNIIPIVRWDSNVVVGVIANGRNEIAGLYDEHGRIAIQGSMIRIDTNAEQLTYSDVVRTKLDEDIVQILETTGLKNVISVEPYLSKPSEYELGMLTKQIPANTQVNEWYVNYLGFKLLDDRYMLSACIHAFYVAQIALNLGKVKSFDLGDLVPIHKPKIAIEKKDNKSVNINHFFANDTKNYS